MIKQKIIYDKDTGFIQEYQEYINDVLFLQELYNEENILIQINQPQEDKITKLFYGDNFWYVVRKYSFDDLSQFEKSKNNKHSGYTLSKFSRTHTPQNPIITTQVISKLTEIDINIEHGTQLCTSINNEDAIKIIRELYASHNLKKYNLFDYTNPKNFKII